jgi:leader peptidase (prepilin peptidase)/N-methyltransferase
VPLVAITATDLERRIIPNRIVLPAPRSSSWRTPCSSRRRSGQSQRFGAALFLFLAAPRLPGGMGMGDVKLALLLGAALGHTVPVALMIGMLAALVPSIVILARHGRRGRKMGIPFGPFLALGGIVALFAGGALLDAYLRLF